MELREQLSQCEADLVQELALVEDCKVNCFTRAANHIDQCLIDHPLEQVAYRACVDAAEAGEQGCITDCRIRANVAQKNLKACHEGSLASMDVCLAKSFRKGFLDD